MQTHYPPPVDELLTFGDCRQLRKWPNYLELGLTREHVPDLIRMATDMELNWADSDSLEVWAPIHAWRALGQLRAEEAIEPLITLFHELETNEWVGEELPDVYGMIGGHAIPALAAYLADTTRGYWPRTVAAHSLKEIASIHPETRGECVSILTKQLERFAEQDPALNGFLIGYLLDLEAVESISAIREAYEAERVDYMINGDLEDVEVELGLKAERSAPATYRTWMDDVVERARAKALAMSVEKKRKIGRNDPCPCGSGKKYKKCCLNRGTTSPA